MQDVLEDLYNDIYKGLAKRGKQICVIIHSMYKTKSLTFRGLGKMWLRYYWKIVNPVLYKRCRNFVELKEELFTHTITDEQLKKLALIVKSHPEYRAHIKLEYFDSVQRHICFMLWLTQFGTLEDISTVADIYEFNRYLDYNDLVHPRKKEFEDYLDERLRAVANYTLEKIRLPAKPLNTGEMTRRLEEMLRRREADIKP